MAAIKLKFPSKDQMWEFVKTVNHIYTGLDFINHTIMCDCSDEHIKLAKENFQAEEIANPTSRE